MKFRKRGRLNDERCLGIQIDQCDRVAVDQFDGVLVEHNVPFRKIFHRALHALFFLFADFPTRYHEPFECLLVALFAIVFRKIGIRSGEIALGADAVKRTALGKCVNEILKYGGDSLSSLKNTHEGSLASETVAFSKFRKNAIKFGKRQLN